MKFKNQYLKILEYLHLSFNKWPSIQYNSRYLLIFETIMGRWSLIPSTKRVSHRESLLKGVAVQGVLYQSILNAKLTGRKNLGRKMCTSNRDNRKLENTVKQSRFKHLGELHKEWTEAGDSASRVTTLRHLQEKGYKPLLKQKHRQKHLIWAKEKNNWTVAQWSKVLFSDKSKCCISFGNQVPRLWRKSGEAQNPCSLKSSVKFPVSDDLGRHVICWCWSTVFSEVHSKCSHLPGNFRALNASFCWQALWRCWFHFPAGHGTCPHCQRYQKLVQWPWCYCAWLASNLSWPEPQRIYGVLSRGRWETPDPTMQMTWRPLSKQPGLLLHRSSATGWLSPCHAALMQ